MSPCEPPVAAPTPPVPPLAAGTPAALLLEILRLLQILLAGIFTLTVVDIINLYFSVLVGVVLSVLSSLVTELFGPATLL